MSVSGLSSSDFVSDMQAKMQQFQNDFQKLGQDLQSGDLSAAQEDFVTLQNDGPQGSDDSSSQASDSISQAFSQLSTDLQSGDLSAAQQDFSNLKQDLQSNQPHGHHHHGSSSDQESSVTQAFQDLSQALQSNNLSAAQQAYSTLQQDLQQVLPDSSSGSSSGSALVNTVESI